MDVFNTIASVSNTIDAGLPVGHQLVAAVIRCDIERVNAILDAHEDLDLNALPGAALIYRPLAAWHSVILSNSGSILHVVSSRQFGLGPRLPALDVSSPAEFAESMEAILTRLLRAGASPHSTDYAGYTPLHWACYNASEWAIRPLLAHGAPVNALDNDGSTPLHKLFRHSPTDGYCLGVPSATTPHPTARHRDAPTAPRTLYRARTTHSRHPACNPALRPTPSAGCSSPCSRR